MQKAMNLISTEEQALHRLEDTARRVLLWLGACASSSMVSTSIVKGWVFMKL